MFELEGRAAAELCHRELAVALDALAGEGYGIYDFGDGPRETAHMVITAQQIARLDSLMMVQDFYEPEAHRGADFDDIEVLASCPRGE